MSRLWKWVDKKKLSIEAKARLFLYLNSLIYSVAGLVVWLIVSRFAFDTLDWALCFVGYPGVFIGYFGGFIFGARNEP